MGSPIEVYNDPVPASVSALPPPRGYVTFVSVDSADRMECMRQAVETEMGWYDVAQALASEPSTAPLLLQIFRIDDTETTVIDFAIAYRHVSTASRERIGPAMVDAWIAAMPNALDDGHRTTYGFVLFYRPQTTLAEYLSDAANSDLIEGVQKATPHLRDLFERIAHSGTCWPDSTLDPHGVSLYMDGNTIQGAVVTDWSSCMTGPTTIQRVMAPLLFNYKKFLDELESETQKTNAEMYLDLVDRIKLLED